MSKTTILIPDEAIHGKLFTIIFEPVCKNFKIELTLEGEDTPFEKCENRSRSNEAGFFMIYPRKLDIKKKKFTEPLKEGDIVIVKCIHEDGTTQENKVTIKN